MPISNITLKVVVALTTNSVEHVEPERSAGYVLTVNPPIYPTIPPSRTVTTWCDWVTNGVPVGPSPLTGPVELGRKRVWETVETFAEERKWVRTGIVTNLPAPSITFWDTGPNGVTNRVLGSIYTTELARRYTLEATNGQHTNTLRFTP